MNVGDVSQQVTVEANAVGSIAAALAPMDASLEATSARTYISPSFIQNFTAPTADYGEAVAMAPGTFTTNGNGVGLGQSNTYFRGFPDGNYDIDFDGVPFYDTNTPSHHSWAFFPAQFLGGIDFDRSPGTASTIGPTPFGGTIHLLSAELSPIQNVRGQFSYGSFNTYLYDAQYDSGNLLAGHKLNFQLDVHHLQSEGYQTFNYQTRNAGDIKVQYKFSDKTVLTGFSGVIWLDANTPNFNATRCQMYGAGTGYTCTGTTLYPQTGAGINFLLTNNSDPLIYLNYQYNTYHVPTDFEYVASAQGVRPRHLLGVQALHVQLRQLREVFERNPDHGTNHDRNGHRRPTSASPSLPAMCRSSRRASPPCPAPSTSTTAIASTARSREVSQVSRFGIFDAVSGTSGPTPTATSTPPTRSTTGPIRPCPTSTSRTVTNSYQPFAEYQCHVTKRLNITPGIKFAYYTIATKQYADNGKTIGCLVRRLRPVKNPAINPNAFITNGGSYFSTLPPAARELPPQEQLVGLRSGRTGQRRSAHQGLRLHPGNHRHCSQTPSAQTAALHHLPGRDRPQAQARYLRRGLLSRPLREQLLHATLDWRARLLPPAQFHHPRL